MLRARRSTIKSDSNGSDMAAERVLRATTRRTYFTESKQVLESSASRKSVKQNGKNARCGRSPMRTTSASFLNGTSAQTNPDSSNSCQAASLSDCALLVERTELLIGRQRERSFIRDFIEKSLIRQHGGGLYISGAPGTGKTAVVLNEVSYLQSTNPSCKVISINCMHLGSASELFGQMFRSLSPRAHGKENRGNVSATTVEAVLNRIPDTSACLLILDEVDQLSSKSQDVLYRIFDWPSTLSCRMIVIGIANALDLTERLLPRLQGKAHQPEHLAFPPYSRNELTEIVSARLSTPGSDSNCIITPLDPLAIQLCARKISASTGDVRTALNICHRAIDIAAQEARCMQKKSKNDAIDSITYAQPNLRHISIALRESQGTNSVGMHIASSGPPVASTVNTTTTDLPLHHKLILASAYLLRKHKNVREISFGQLYETYSFICTNRRLGGLEESELSTVCGLLDSRGYVHFTASKSASNNKLDTPARFRRIRLRLDDRSVELLLADDILFSNILHLNLPG
ncbi:Cell division control protein [Paragonimus heterotremus]|uniref:Cell division control protein n=1 Tax=Paragonimus heterotremus TaxID=100268 RepID=A0A8J4WEX0_9TREM|nr:Cell division control protein [Paragonimus heterotremus]